MMRKGTGLRGGRRGVEKCAMRGLLGRLWICRLFLFGMLVLEACAQAPANAPSNGTMQRPSDTEVNALLSIKRAFFNPKSLSSWNDSGYGVCDSWLGVRCSANGEVISLVLPGKTLFGNIPEDIGNLTALRKLSLHSNALTGTVPQSIGTLTNLRGLALHENGLNGEIPLNIGNSSVLQALDLSYNYFWGTLPALVTQSPKLLSVEFANNFLSGPFPYEWTLNNSATYIGVSFNNLTGPLPPFSASAFRLGTLDLRGNYFYGNIPSSLSSVSTLSLLLLAHNQFEGPIPPELGSLSSLSVVDVSSNSLNGSIPVDLLELPSLVYVDFSGNNFTGPVLPQLGDLNLTVLSLRGNKFSGNIPAELGNMPFLSSLDLSHNELNGSIPSTFGGLRSLQSLNLAYNHLRGRIPDELANASNLAAIDLSYNNLGGSVPAELAQLMHLTRFNVSYNNLSGPVPVLAHDFNGSSYLGNVLLCGIAGLPACTPSPAPAPEMQTRKKKHRKLSTAAIVCIVLGATLLALALICVCLLCLWKRRSQKKKGGAVAGNARSEKQIDQSLDSEEVGGKLVHFDGPLAFSADHLLCATAEVLGKSAYGTVYKATLEDGNIIAVKRLREGIVKGQKEFETEVGSLGKIRNPNLLALRAYYWGPKDEKLLVFDYMSCGSLAAFLHARGPETPLNWATRMKIAMGAATGLAHLHDNENIIHGNLTASNILLDARMNARISDYGLSRLMTPQAMSSVIATAGTLGYRAPELAKTKKPTTKSDTYSFGIVLLELLTGKAPMEQTSSDSGMDLAEWVSSVVKEEWTSEVFDVEIIKETAAHAEEEMMNALQLALVCVNTTPTSRPEMEDVVRQLEEIRPDLRQSPESDATTTPAPELPESEWKG